MLNRLVRNLKRKKLLQDWITDGATSTVSFKYGSEEQMVQPSVCSTSEMWQGFVLKEETLEQLEQFICEASASNLHQWLLPVALNIILRLSHVTATQSGNIKYIIMWFHPCYGHETLSIKKTSHRDYSALCYSTL